MSDVARNNIVIKCSTRFTSVALPTSAACESFSRYYNYVFIVTKIKSNFKKIGDAVIECDQI